MKLALEIGGGVILATGLFVWAVIRGAVIVAETIEL